MINIKQIPDIVNMKFGSHLYGLDTPQSDVDWKGIYLPSLVSLLLGNYAKTYKASSGGTGKNTADDIDLEVVSLPRFIQLACDGETFAIDMLHSDAPIHGEYGFIWDELVDRRTEFYSKNLKAFVGYVKRQAAKYGVKGSRLKVMEDVLKLAKIAIDSPYHIRVSDIIGALPINEHASIVTNDASKQLGGEQVFYELCGRKFQDTLKVEVFAANVQKIYDSYGARAQAAKDNNGIDWKAMSHALRAGYQARDIYLFGDFEYPLNETGLLLDVKQGKLDFITQVSPVLEELVDEVNVLSEGSELQEKVDRNKWDLWLLEVYDNVYNCIGG